MKKSMLLSAMLDQSIPYVIAETAYIHQGDIGYLFELIERLGVVKCCDAIKYHILIDVDSYITPSHELYGLYQTNKFSTAQWSKILEKTCESGFESIVLADEIRAIDYVKDNIKNVHAIELHAIALNNMEMLERVKDIEIPIILGVGGSQIEDIDYALKYLGNKEILLMHGFQNYPTKYQFINLKRISKLKEKFRRTVGYADHTSWDDTLNETITLSGFLSGANILEKHVALNAGEDRIDYNSAISIDALRSIYDKLRIIQDALGDGSFIISDYENIYALNGPMKFTVVATRDIPSGHIISKNDIAFKRTNEVNNIRQRDYLEIIGKKAKKEIKIHEILNWEKLER
jgi:N,N'-diacetyllegionaminate synthase